jgi:hypothetical protein
MWRKYSKKIIKIRPVLRGSFLGCTYEEPGPKSVEVAACSINNLCARSMLYQSVIYELNKCIHILHLATEFGNLLHHSPSRHSAWVPRSDIACYQRCDVAVVNNVQLRWFAHDKFIMCTFVSATWSTYGCTDPHWQTIFGMKPSTL